MLLKTADYPHRLKYYEARTGRSELTKQQSEDFWSTKQGYIGEAQLIELLLKRHEIMIL